MELTISDSAVQISTGTAGSVVLLAQEPTKDRGKKEPCPATTSVHYVYFTSSKRRIRMHIRRHFCLHLCHCGYLACCKLFTKVVILPWVHISWQLRGWRQKAIIERLRRSLNWLLHAHPTEQANNHYKRESNGRSYWICSIAPAKLLLHVWLCCNHLYTELC